MDATALTVYRYFDTYIVIPCFRDGYPRGLGTSLVQNVPTDMKEFDDWLNKTRESYKAISKKLKHSDSDGDFGYIRGPCSEGPVNDEKIRWIYTIDLDRVVFSVNNGAHFRLDSIPRGENGEEWIRFLGQDGSGKCCLKPSTPPAFVAELYPRIDSEAIGKDAAEYNTLDTTVIEPGEWAEDGSIPKPASEVVTTIVVKALIGHFYGSLCNTCQYGPADPHFQRPAESLLRAVAPNFLKLHLDGDDLEKLTPGAAEIANEDIRGRRPGVFYWFRGCLILLSTQLDSKKQLEASVTRVITRIREKGIKACTALIWSIRHVVAVRILNDRVMHTMAEPVLAAFGTDDAAFDTSVRLMARCLRPVCTETRKGDVDCSSVPISGGLPPDARVALPTDIILEIMRHVDAKTYSEAFSRLSSATRTVWAKRPRIGPYTICGVVSISGSRKQESSQTNSRAGVGENGNECAFLAYTEDGGAIRLNLIYRGHPLLGNCPLYSSSDLGRTACVIVRWPHEAYEDCGEYEGLESWREVRQCELYLQMLS